MRSPSLRLLLALGVLIFAPSVFAHDVTISGTTSFAALDGSPLDHDGVANGVFTVSDGNLIVNGVVNCNDDGGGDSACSMAFAVSGNMTINSGGALYAENRTGGGSGGSITLTVGGNLALNGTAIISTASKSSTGATGGAITANVGGTVALAGGTTIDSGAANARGGNIAIVAGGVVTIDGNVLSGPSRTILSTRLTDAVLDGGTANTIGGAISIRSSTFVEPAVLINSNANIVSQGETGGSGGITVEGCGIQVRGLVAALGKGDSTGSVAIRSGKALLVDARDLGAASGTRMGRVRADASSGNAINRGVDLFAPGTVSVLGPGGSLFAVTSHPGVNASKSYGGTIRILSTGDAVTISGNAVDTGRSASGDSGGTISVSSKGNANLDTAVLRAIGDSSTNNPNRGGGSIAVRSYSGNVVWTNGTGDVRPVGSSSGLVPGDQGTIVLTACGTINTTGTSFPVMGTATAVFPETHTGVCSPAAPSLPAGVPPFVTCNTPPVANPASASTNEDNAVTVHLSGSDADGDSLTFTIVTPPAHGSLGPVVSTGPTTADVVYTPALNYNGTDTFVFRANDGNGGTNDNTATITIAPVNDPPSFQLGANQTALEDSGAHSVANWVTSISPGPADESGQSVTFTVTNDNPSLFSVQPAVAPNGTLTYTSAPDAYGTATITVVAHDNGGTANGGVDTSAPQTSSITITPVNDAPSFVKGANQSVNEDAGPQSVAGWATSISAGPNEGSQSVNFVLTNDNNALFSAQPAVSPGGTLTYTPAPNANGSATVTVVLHDDGGTANGGVDTSAPQTFTITVVAVNDAPSFTSGGNVAVLEDSGAYSAPWATNVSAGPPDESGQSVNFSTSNNNPALFAVAPSVSPSGVLSFTPAPNANGTATVTVTLFDNGGTANGGSDTSAPQTFTITVTAVNDAPSFTPGGNVAVNEDSGAYSAAWASAISAGPNEGSQTVAFHASNSNNALFAVQPAVSPSGVLSFVPAANANGSATVTVYLQDDGGTANGGVDTSASVTFVITVSPVNDPPSFTGGGDVSVGEDSGAYSAPWATNISAGPANESSQSVTFTSTNNNNALFSVQPSVAPDGTLTFTPAANANGSAVVTVVAHDDGGTANGGSDTSAAQTFTISVTGVNDAPSFTPGANQTSFEDGGPQSVAWATNISAGPNESSQSVTFVVTNDNNALFAVQPAISATGTLTYTAAPNMNGSATVTVYLKDDGGTANGGVDQSAPVTFTITVVAVNDAPSFTSGGDVTALEDSGAYSAAWATNISAGPPDESTQTVSFTATNNNNALFSVQPSISPAGVLTFTPAPNANGDAIVTVVLHDDGGTANGGADASAAITFTIHVTPVNDAPSFTPGSNVAIDENSGAYSAPWATNISAGPANESGQTVHFNVSNDNNALFSAQPAISPAGVLTFTSAPNAFGSATVTVSLQDNGGTANGGVDTSASVTFTITINRVNQPPVAVNDTFATFGNTELRVDLAAGATPSVIRTTPSGRGVLHNDTDADGDPLVVTGIVGCADNVAPFDCTLATGTLSMNANGTFSFKPAPGVTSATFQYTVSDQPSFGVPGSSTATVTITTTHVIWYVNGSAAAGGNGTSASPFKDFSTLDGAGGAGDVDGPNDIIFVHDSTVNGAGLELEDGQHFLGEGVGLTVDAITLVPAGNKPRVFSSVTSAAFIHVANTAEVAGLELHGGDGILVSNGGASSSGTINASIHHNAIIATQIGIDVLTPAGSATTVNVDNTSINAAGIGYSVVASTPASVSYTNGSVLSTGAAGIVFDGSRSGGNLTVTGFANVTVDGATAGDGIDILDAKFDSGAAAGFQTVNGGTIAVGTSANPVGSNGIVLTNVSGDFAATSLSAFGTTGLTVGGSGLFTGAAGMRLAVAGGALSGSGGVGLSVTNATIAASGLNFTSIASTRAVNGIRLNNTGSGPLTVSGTGSAASGGIIDIASATGVRLDNCGPVSLSWMRVQSSGDDGIGGANVGSLTLANTSLTNNGNAAGDSGIEITNLGGTSSISSSTVTGSFDNNVWISNSTGSSTLNVTNSTFSNTSASGNDGFFVQADGTANVTVSVTGSTFTNNRGDHFQFATTTTATGTNSVNFSNNTLTGAASNLGAGITLSTAGSSVTNYTILTNNIQGAVSSAVTANLVSSSASGRLNGRISDNTIGSAAVTDSGSSQGDGITVFSNGAGISTVSITNNLVRQYSNLAGINVRQGSGSGSLFATITGNTVSDPGTFASNGILVQAGALSTDNGLVCANVTGNNITGSGANGGTDFRYRQRFLTTFRVPGYAGAANDNTAVVNYVAGLNGGASGSATNNVAGGGAGFVGGSACPTP
jgi:hypothetical protein